MPEPHRSIEKGIIFKASETLHYLFHMSKRVAEWVESV